MDETPDPLDAVVDAPAPPVPSTKATPIDSRFLFVDIAALRAKQLRRGALPRLDQTDAPDRQRITLFKPERIAMEEVSRGLVLYELPTFKHAEA